MEYLVEKGFLEVPLYWFDIEIHLFSIKLNRNMTNKSTLHINKSLERIILSTEGFEVKSLTEKEINDMINSINKLSKTEYKYFAVPSLDLGLYKRYVSKKRVIEILKYGLDKSTDIDSNVVRSKISNPWRE